MISLRRCIQGLSRCLYGPVNSLQRSILHLRCRSSKPRVNRELSSATQPTDDANVAVQPIRP